MRGINLVVTPYFYQVVVVLQGRVRVVVGHAVSAPSHTVAGVSGRMPPKGSSLNGVVWVWRGGLVGPLVTLLTA